MLLQRSKVVTNLSAFVRTQSLRRPSQFHLSRHLLNAAVPPRLSELAGTVAQHDIYILLHTHRSPREYPSRPSSSLLKALSVKALNFRGLVNFAWSPDWEAHPDYTGLGGDAEEEVYNLTAFSWRGGRIEIPKVSQDTLESVAVLLEGHTQGVPHLSAVPDKNKLHLFVCTHGQRDCRCGDRGGEVAIAMREEVERRGLTKDIVVGEVAHVGGHKYAANMLIFPSGDWLGTLQAVDVPRVLDEILETHATSWADVQEEVPPNALPVPCPPFWRGRMGCSKESQLTLLQDLSSRNSL